MRTQSVLIAFLATSLCMVEASEKPVTMKTPQKSGDIKEITSLEEYNRIMTGSGDKPVLIEFTATWCSACKLLKPELKKIAQKHPEIAVYAIDVDTKDLQTIKKKYVSRGIPTLVLFDKNHKYVSTRIGSCSEREIEKMLDNLTTKPAKKKDDKSQTSGITRIQTMQEYQAFINKHDLAVIEISASWCGACKEFESTFSATSQEYPSVGCAQINIENVDEQLKKFVAPYKSLPTLLYIKKGAIVDTSIGAYPEVLLKEHIKKALFGETSKQRAEIVQEAGPQKNMKTQKPRGKRRRGRR